MGPARVLIIGGGLSGLLSLAQAILGSAQVDLIEASQNLGGRGRNFEVDVNEENKVFLSSLGVPTEGLTPLNADSIIRKALLSFVGSQSVKNLRVICNAKATSILTDQEGTRVLGIRFTRTSTSASGKPFVTECKIFGDSLIFALEPEEIGNLCPPEFARITDGKVLMVNGDLHLSKENKTTSLNSFISQARCAGKSAAESISKIFLQSKIHQPLPFKDKEGIFHGVALNSEKWVPLILETRFQLNQFNHLFRFSLPQPTMQVGLFCGQYISIRAFLDGKELVRHYSPVSRNSDYGHLDLMIKIEEEKLAEKPMERILRALQPGQAIEFKGPAGGFEYHRNMYREVGMIAGGTGITPMVQIIRSVANHPEDDTRIKLLYGNYNEEDILCRDELSYYSLTRSNISVYISLVNAPGKWSMGTGFVTKDMIRNTLPAPANDVVLLLCGPPPMIKFLIPLLKELGYTDQMIFNFI